MPALGGSGGPEPAGPDLGQPAAGVPAQLPAGVADFTGRAAELCRLDAFLTPDDAPPSESVKIVAITGAPGVGKTALAVHWAHRAASRFSGGQLFVSLRGHASAQPLQPVEALAHLLRGLGVEPLRIPVGLEEAAGLYRTLTAKRQLLVVLDDAASAAQVRPLLPGGPACLVVITSRDRLSGLAAREGAQVLPLGVLIPGDAAALLARILGPERAAAEAGAATELTRLCGRLPLALRIAAAKLTTQPHYTITDQVAELSATTGLAALEVDGDEQAAVRAAFDSSYLRLPADSRRLFRLLGLVPGTDVTTAAAAALADIEPEDAKRQLERLATAHLIDCHAPGRYRFHELLRLYAIAKADSDELPGVRAAASARLAFWYLSMLDAAAQLLYPDMLRLPMPAPPQPVRAVGFSGHAVALDWLDAECDHLTAAISLYASQGLPQFSWLLADGLRGYFHLRWRSTDWLSAVRAAQLAAQAHRDPMPQAAVQISLAHLHWNLRRYADSIRHYTAATALARQGGWDAAEAAALGNAGGVYSDMGRPHEAIASMSEALALDRRAGRELSQANKLANLGYAYRTVGRLEDAATACDLAIAVARQVGSCGSEAHSLSNRAQVHREAGELDLARDQLIDALVRYQQIGDRSGEADVLNNLAAVESDAGQDAKALGRAQEALALARQIGDERTEIDALRTLSGAHLRLGRGQQAVILADMALRISAEAGTCYQRAQALLSVAAARHYLGDLAQSRSCAEQAVVIASEAGYLPLRVQAEAALDAASRPWPPRQHGRIGAWLA